MMHGPLKCQIHQYQCQYQVLLRGLHQRYQKEHGVGSVRHVSREIEACWKYNFQTGKFGRIQSSLTLRLLMSYIYIYIYIYIWSTYS